MHPTRLASALALLVVALAASALSAKPAVSGPPEPTPAAPLAERAAAPAIQKCGAYTSMRECLHHGQCGWCGETGKCIAGNAQGPLEPCEKSTYIHGE